jgi:acyl-CoA synthetase (AMP-forming)/AMP-acid ligase II
MLNLAVMLENSARTVPDRTAVVLGDLRMTYAELDTAARRVAGLLRSRGIGPGDKMVAVLGVPHVTHGEEVKACVVLAPGAELAEAELIAWCRDRMAGYKYPRQVEFRGRLPTNATGKILKRELRGVPTAP